MTTNMTVNAADNPDLANKLVSEALSATDKGAETFRQESTIKPPSNPVVELLAGIRVPFGEPITYAEVRELTGADEEAISRLPDLSKGLMLMLDRAVVKLGNKKPDADLMDIMLAGDRELLLLAIRKLTFGNELTVRGPLCGSCPDEITLIVDLEKDVAYKKLEGDPEFTVDCKIGPVRVKLPTGITQKALVASTNKTAPELDTVVLKDCVLEIAGNPVIGPTAVLNLSVMDRRTILNAISDRNPGPQLSETKKSCPNCGQEVSLPLTLADLFQQ
jgi:hypothetical protein